MFQNRADACFQLAQKLKSYQTDYPLVLTLPRGGVPMGYEVAQVLKTPLDVFVVRKIGASQNPEFGIGAVAPEVQILDKASIHSLGIKTFEVEEIIEREQQELKRRQKLYQQTEDLQIYQAKQ